MPSPSPSVSRSGPSNLRICSTCEGPMRGHTRVDRKNVCPSREKQLETLYHLWDEGHHDFVLSIAKKLELPFTSPLQTPSTPSTPIPLPISLADRLRQRKPTPFTLPDDLDHVTPKLEGSVSTMTSSLRRMISKVIDERNERNSPPRSPSLSSSDTTIPDTSSDGLPAIGPWNQRRLQDWSEPAEQGDMPHSERGSLVPTLLIGSDGQTIREGSRAEAHFRAQAALEARLRRQQEQQFETTKSESYEGLSVIQLNTSNGEQDYEGSGFHRVLRSVMASPAIMAIPVRPEDIPRVQETAARQGLHTSVLEVVPRTPRGTSRALPQMFRNALVQSSGSMQSIDSAEDDRPIVVIGRDLAMTQRYVEMAQRGVMPGTVTPEHTGPRVVTVPQLIFVLLFTVMLVFALFFFFFLWPGS